MHIDASWLTVALAAVSVLLIPALAILVRGAIRWTRTEDKLAELVTDVKELVSDRDKMNAAILEQMRSDREATDKRLRFIEEFFMRRGRDALLPGLQSIEQVAQLIPGQVVLAAFEQPPGAPDVVVPVPDDPPVRVLSQELFAARGLVVAAGAMARVLDRSHARDCTQA